MTENPCVPGSIPGGTTRNQNAQNQQVKLLLSVSFLCKTLLVRVKKKPRKVANGR